MQVLSEGMEGKDVLALQKRLQKGGFSPGAIDGIFGPATEAALIAFQKSDGLFPDGVVNVETAKALGFAASNLPPAPSMPKVTVAIVSKMFPQTPLDHIKANLPPVLTALEDARLTSLPIVLAALATIRAEVESFMPISEYLSRFNTSPGGKPFDLYDYRRDLGNQGPPDGSKYKGRGFVQLTGRTNYTKYGSTVGVDLIGDPDKANDPTIAGKLLAAFVKAKSSAISAALAAGDFATARRCINGGTNGLERFTEAYQIGARTLS
jgi:peptidoglycan L-alanyl-D-glutamate endopeptidase CwlK